MSTYTERSARYETAASAYNAAEAEFWTASIAEAQSMIPHGVQALIFRVNDTPRLAFDAYVDEHGEEAEAEEINHVAYSLDLFDALDNIAALLPVYDAEDADNWLLRHENRDRFVIRAADRCAPIESAPPDIQRGRSTFAAVVVSPPMSEAPSSVYTVRYTTTQEDIMTLYDIDREVIDQAAQMVGYWNSTEVLSALNMSEGFTLAALFDALHAHDVAEHIIREVWEGEADDCRDPLPWANGHGSRLTEDEYNARSDDLAHNEGDERFRFAPRLAFEDEPDVIEYYDRS